MQSKALFLSIFLFYSLVALTQQNLSTAWPAISQIHKPWTRWWWPGSAIDRPGITYQLEQLAASGIGGVEITPIFGAKGYEDRYIDFLSPKWMEMLEHVGREGKRLGLGIDMATGTGWPFGGAWIKESDALARAILKDGRIEGQSTGMMVKRAAPGAEGLVVDPYSTEALIRYLAPFEKAFSKFPRGLVRGQFHDSFEYYNGSWTPGFADIFQEMHGYDIQQFATELFSKPEDVESAKRDQLARIKSDFRETLAKLHLDYLRTWVEWSHKHGFLVRNQSHGAPANLLDLYANADIAETEVYGSTPFPIPGLRRMNNEVHHGQDLPESLVIRMASSASHVSGHILTSSETCTWLREHWKVALSYAKPEIDRIFADGINHIFYHGTVYSPKDVPWPGWLFYASTQFNPNNTWWEDFGALNQYVTRIQSILQRGKPDNDILLYWPLADVWDNPEGLMMQLGVHDVKWLTEQPVGKLAGELMKRGYGFDYISDAQLQKTTVDIKQLVTSGARYKVLIVPSTRRMPLATIKHLQQLAEKGATIIFQSLPEDVSGFANLEKRRAAFKQLTETFDNGSFVQPDVLSALGKLKVPREVIADSGISFIRRAHGRGHDYFFANLSGKKFEGWVKLGVTARSAMLRDPLNGRNGMAAVKSIDNQSLVYLQLQPGQTLLLETINQNNNVWRKTSWIYYQQVSPAFAIKGIWDIKFIKGGPELPESIKTDTLQSWTILGGVEAKRFGGTARYRIEFDMSGKKSDEWMLDLGEVRESARIKINGRTVGTAWSNPFQVHIGEFLKPGHNILEVEVTNLAANRIRDMDQRKVNWKIMREINFVNIDYRPFDASGWEITPSGLIGPVKLIPMKRIN